MFPVAGDVLYGLFVYRNDPDVVRLDMSAFQDLLVIVRQHGLVVADTVADRRIGTFHVQHRP